MVFLIGIFGYFLKKKGKKCMGFVLYKNICVSLLCSHYFFRGKMDAEEKIYGRTVYCIPNFNPCPDIQKR